jgi:high-affinity Fe2+/Pb2+ permease
VRLVRLRMRVRMMKRRLPMMARLVIGVVVGGILGYCLYRFVGCSSGACPITSNPWVSTIVGMVIGGLSSGAV